ncbi:hypothetical protein D3C72_1449880 [compost metagenome]
MCQSVFWFFFFFLKSSKKTIPKSKHISVIFIQVFFIRSMVNTMNRRCYENILQPFYSANKLCMCKKRICSVNNQHCNYHCRMKSDERQNTPKSRSYNCLKSRNSGGCCKIKFFAMMMHDMGSPEKIDFVP